MKRSLAISSLLFLSLACGVHSSAPINVPVEPEPKLEAFANCDELENHIEDVAVRNMRAMMEQNKQYTGSLLASSTTPTADRAESKSGAAMETSSAPNAYTTTNVQVGGVDEADFVKNDGTRILVLSNNTLYLSQERPADEMKLRSTLELEGQASQMFLDEHDRVVVFSHIYTQEEGGTSRCYGCGYYGNGIRSSTKITVVDISNLDAPKVITQLYAPGYYSNSRRIGSSVRVVLGDNFRYPADVQMWVNVPPFTPPFIKDQQYAEQEDRNEKLIRDWSLEHWLPKASRIREDGEKLEVGYACTDFTRSNTPADLGILTVAMLNLDDAAAPLARSSILGMPGEVYSSKNALYITHRHWWAFTEDGQTDHTYVHKFDISNADKAVYVASGGMEGHMVDQFSMDEDDNGLLRTALTITKVHTAPSWSAEVTNRVSIFRQDGQRLVLQGQTEDFSKGERIFSTRFVGKVGYVVTFRQTDPLLTIDLSDPEHPKKVGELHVPGFSSYIHPIDENNLLTVGMETDANGRNEWMVKVSIFDVKDLANPVETAHQTMGPFRGWSEALYEHKAFNYFAERHQLAIPIVNWERNWSGFRSELQVLNVDTRAGFTDLGSVSLSDMFITRGNSKWSYTWTPQVRRSVMADEFVYAISDAGIRVARADALASSVGTVEFPESKVANNGGQVLGE